MFVTQNLHPMFESLRIVYTTFRKGLMLVAGAIVLLHVLVPHWHEAELNAQAHDALHRQNNSVVHLLQLFLHEADQMDDEVIPSTSLPTAIVFVAVVVSLFVVELSGQTTKAWTGPGHQHLIFDRGCLSATGCRPPPFLG